MPGGSWRISPPQNNYILSCLALHNITNAKWTSLHEVDSTAKIVLQIVLQSNLYHNSCHGKLEIHVRETVIVFQVCICFHFSLKIRVEQSLGLYI